MGCFLLLLPFPSTEVFLIARHLLSRWNLTVIKPQAISVTRTMEISFPFKLEGCLWTKKYFLIPLLFQITLKGLATYIQVLQIIGLCRSVPTWAIWRNSCKREGHHGYQHVGEDSKCPHFNSEFTHWYKLPVQKGFVCLSRLITIQV